jgi:ferredoxin
MEIESAKLVYFSPTRTTQQVLEGIVRGLEVEQVAHLDLTLPQAGTRPLDEMHAEMALLGAPVYGGRIPLQAERRLLRLKGNRTPAVVVVVYGNRAYEDALLELRDLAVEAGFVPVAGAAFIGEHSFSTDARPVAHGRPDGSDLRQAAAFGRMIRARMRGLPRLDEMPLLHVPGHAPPKERGNPWGISPATREALCTYCGTCVAVCPTAAIAADAITTDTAACILCCACVKNCPTGARALNHPRIQQSRKWLNESCAERREPEVYV